MPAPNFRLHSKAFRQGLIDGFGSPAFFFVPYQVKYRRDFSSLRKTWENVSKRLDESFQAEREAVGEAKQKSTTGKKLAHAE